MRRWVRYGVVGVVAAAVVGAGVGAVRYQDANSPALRDFSAFGVPLAAAGCQAPLTDPVSGRSETIGPGTAQPSVTRVDYATVPPSSGPHTAVPVYPNLAFYTVRDSPRVEQLVHNMEHGYTILWYDPALADDQLSQVADLAAKVRSDATTAKFIAAPWDTTRGRFAGGATIALSHWGSTAGHRQLCARLSGEAVHAFLLAHPSADSPEPAAP